MNPEPVNVHHLARCCPKCGSGTFHPTGLVYAIGPPLDEFRYDSCGHKRGYERKVPGKIDSVRRIDDPGAGYSSPEGPKGSDQPEPAFGDDIEAAREEWVVNGMEYGPDGMGRITLPVVKADPINSSSLGSNPPPAGDPTTEEMKSIGEAILAAQEAINEVAWRFLKATTEHEHEARFRKITKRENRPPG